jgi:hypothetical protein
LALEMETHVRLTFLIDKAMVMVLPVRGAVPPDFLYFASDFSSIRSMVFYDLSPRRAGVARLGD